MQSTKSNEAHTVLEEILINLYDDIYSFVTLIYFIKEFKKNWLIDKQ